MWEYISKINLNTEKEFLLLIVTWERLDVDSFLAVNNTRSKLKTAIMQRDTYYGEVCQSLRKNSRRKKAMEKQINRLNSEITNLQNEVEKLRTVNTNKINQYLAEVVLKCKKVLETYVYPDLCNEILQKKDLMECLGKI